MRFTDGLAPMHHGTLCLPPSATALNPAQEKGLSPITNGYEDKTGTRAPPFPGSPPVTSPGADPLSPASHRSLRCLRQNQRGREIRDRAVPLRESLGPCHKGSLLLPLSQA